MLPFDNTDTAFGTAGNAFADGFDFNIIFHTKLKQAFIWSGFDFLACGNKF